MKQPWVLGISASHNGACCLLHGDEIKVAIQEERLVGRKRSRIHGARPSLSLAYCLQTAGITPGDLSMIVLTVQGARRDPEEDLSVHPHLRAVADRVPTACVPHHWAHAMSAYATSGWSDAAVLVVDGLGSPFADLFDAERGVARGAGDDGWEALSTYVASPDGLQPLDKHLVPAGRWLLKRRDRMWGFRSLGGMFSAVAEQLFGDPMEAGKVMGLAPYGTPGFGPEEFFVARDGLFEFQDRVPARFPHHDRWPRHETAYANLAASVQAALEVALLEAACRLRRQSGLPRLCYAGGVALNGIANQRILRERVVSELHVIPAAEDSGAAVGAAYWGLAQLAGGVRRRRQRRDAAGRCYSPAEIDRAISKTPMIEEVRHEDLVGLVVDWLCAGEIGGWFEGGCELGPRALGQRSILCDPRRRDAKDILNSRVKHREAFRPFAPAVALEHVPDWFELHGTPASSPFMLRVCSFRAEKAAQVPGVSHVDGTGRLQSVEEGSRLHDLLSAFHARTGVPMLVNTSFNVAGEPIVETPEDALWCLLATGLDFCVLGDRVVRKSGAFRSFLDFVPRVSARRWRLESGNDSGQLQADGGPGLAVGVSTRWGEAEQVLHPRHIRLLSLIDGRRTGREILEQSGHAEETALVHELMLLRRLHVIDFVPAA